jgi:uncharacterized membrane protein YcaP (DUF421 family)
MQDYVFDLHRIFIGNTSWEVLIEIALRTSILYLYARLLIRIFFGKQVVSKLSTFQLLIVLIFALVLGRLMIAPEFSLLHGMLALTGIVLVYKATRQKAYKIDEG